MIHISTDYVFDGTRPPYSPSDNPNPLNNYARSKLQSEQIVQDIQPEATILRVPVLFGPTDRLEESAISILSML